MSTTEHGSDLFRSAKDWQLNACVNFGHDDWDVYAEGYRRAGEILIARLAATNGESIDFLVYPLVFLFRHALELHLKSAIRWGRLVLNRPSRGYPLGHKLIEFWSDCRALAEEYWPDDPTDLLDDIERTLREFEKHDPDGQAFRYSVDTGGTRTKPRLTHINLRVFYEQAIKAYNLLDGMSTAFENAWQEWCEHQA